MNFLTITKQVFTITFAVVIFGCSDNEPFDCTSGRLEAEVSKVIDASCGLPNGSFELSVSGGIGPFTFSLTGSDFQNLQAANHRIEAVPPGNYNLNVRDTNGCTANVTLNINNRNSLSVRTIIVASGCEASNGMVTFNVSGGKEPYLFSLNGEATQSENTFSGLKTDEYMALVTDTNGCQANITISLTSGTSYKNEIIPIINANCAIANCHDGMDTTLPNLTEFATIQSLAETIKHRTSNETMPPAEQPGLKPAEIRSIACWVDDGGLNN